MKALRFLSSAHIHYISYPWYIPFGGLIHRLFSHKGDTRLDSCCSLFDVVCSVFLRCSSCTEAESSVPLFIFLCLFVHEREKMEKSVVRRGLVHQQ